MKVYIPRTVLLDGREVEALVPIEAEEERIDQSTFAFPDHHLTRLVTPWEEA